MESQPQSSSVASAQERVSHLQPRDWKLPSAEGLTEKIDALEKETGLSRFVLRVLIQRGVETSDAIHEFLSPRLETLKDPFLIADLRRATERLAQARAQEEKIRVFGDYDVDGTTGATLLQWVLTDFGFKGVEVRQPDRFRDGYGLNTSAVEEAAAEGVKILIAVDCGITAFDQATRARELGIDLIIVDHHQLDVVRGLPEAYAVVNPQRPDCPSGLKQLCGCGLAFYLSRGLRSLGRELSWWPAGQEPNLKQHLDLVVIATAADLVPLIGDNHVLVRHGLEVLKHSKKPGVKALMDAAGLSSRELSPGHLGFTLGPRINASGRMGSASLAQTLLATRDPGEGARLAYELEKINKERAELQNRIWDQVRVRVEEGIAAGRFRHGIVVGDEAWHEGVVGIVASRVVETFRRPAAVIGFRDGHGKGSVRSFASKDVLAALRESAEHLASFGGHRHAAGLSLKPENLEKFSLAFDDALSRIQDDATARPLNLEAYIDIGELTTKALQELERLGPFGPGNPEPLFAIKAEVASNSLIKMRHLKLKLARRGVGAGAPMEGIWFHGAERPEYLDGSLVEGESYWAGFPELNRFRGNVTPTFRVKDWRRDWAVQ